MLDRSTAEKRSRHKGNEAGIARSGRRGEAVNI